MSLSVKDSCGSLRAKFDRIDLVNYRLFNRLCIDCGKKVCHKNKSHLCKDCYNKRLASKRLSEQYLLCHRECVKPFVVCDLRATVYSVGSEPKLFCMNGDICVVHKENFIAVEPVFKESCEGDSI